MEIALQDICQGVLLGSTQGNGSEEVGLSRESNWAASSLNKDLIWSPRELWSWGEGTIPLYLCWPVTGCGLYRKGNMTRPPTLQRNSLERTDSLGLLPRHPQQLEDKSLSSGGESGQRITMPSTLGLRTLVWGGCQWIGGDSPRLGHRGGSQSRYGV